MGLDMYLYAEKWMTFTDARSKDEDVKKEIAKILGVKGADVESVRCLAAYWRKANSIHKWFVDNCQDGKDECQESDVSREDLVKLRDLCQKTIDSRDPKRLPTQEGLFFGSVKYDDLYFDDVRNTIELIDKALATFSKRGWHFIYRASW